MRAVLRWHFSPSGDERSVRHAPDEREQTMPFERESKIRQYQPLERGRKDGRRSVIGAVEEHCSTTRHGGGNAIGLRKRHPRFDEYGERRVERRHLSTLCQSVGNARRVARAGEHLSDSFEECAVGANE